MPQPREQDPKAIREQLQRILASPGFLHSERLRRFLTHCVESALSGRIGDLKEYTIGVAAFDRPKHYNPSDDPIVRVEARRLRAKLDGYYQGCGAADPVVIELPKGGYLPIFHARTQKPAGQRYAFRTTLLAAALTCVAAGYWLFARGGVAPEVALTRVTSGHGLNTDPALSADGSILVYASDRASSAGLHIWLQRLAHTPRPDTARQITDDPADDSQPAISPDASEIVFRSERQPPGLYVVPTSGGPAKLLVPDGRNPRFSPRGQSVAYWVGSPGGGSLAPAGRVFIMDTKSGAAATLLSNFASSACPVWSPRGDRVLVLAKQAASDPLDLWTVATDGSQPLSTGIAALLDRAKLSLGLRECSLSWGRESLVFSAASGDTQNLWQLPVSANGRPAGRVTRFTFGSAEEALPSESASGDVAFANRTGVLDVWRLPVDPPGELTRLTEGITAPAFPGVHRNHLTFLSKAEGRSVLWLKDLASGQSTQFTRVEGEPQYPQLCPDGETVLYSDAVNTSSVNVRSPSPRLVCNGCSRVWQCTGRGFFYVPAGSITPVPVDEFLSADGRKSQLLVSNQHDVAGAQLSSDGWLAFHTINGVAERQIFVARYAPGRRIPEQDWIPVTDGHHLDRNAVWNEQADALYFLSERCGFRCIWRLRLDRSTKRVIAAPEAVHHFHSARQGLSATGDVGAIGLSYSAGNLYFTLSDQGGDVWLARTNTKRK